MSSISSVNPIAVIIVNYNTRDLLQSCLKSVLASTSPATGPNATPLDLQIIVVDNASQDASAELVADKFPTVKLIPLDSNIGFTAANNLALKHLGICGQSDETPPPHNQPKPDFVLLLNADTEVAADALYHMANFLRQTPHAGACGARLEYGDGTFQHGAFHFPTLMQIALDFFPLASLPLLRKLQDSRLNGRYPASSWNQAHPFPVDFVLGAAMMVRTSAIETVGGLDEGFFMYCEEMDWALRLTQAGMPVYAVPAARVVHHAGQSSRQVQWTAYEHLWQSRYRFYRKHHHRYGTLYRRAVQLLVRAGLAWRRRQALHHFAQGHSTGLALAEELATYQRISNLPL